MPRIRRIVLLLAGVASISLLSACDEDKKTARNAPPPAAQGKLYKDLDSCLAEAKSMDEVTSCRDAYHQAQEKMAEAPRFDQQARCEDVYGPGNCVPRDSVVHEGGGGFVPFMMGFWMGHLGGGMVYQPVFIDRSGATYAGSQAMASPRWVGTPPPMAATGRAAMSPAPSGSVARGGFGSTAMTTALPSVGG